MIIEFGVRFATGYVLAYFGGLWVYQGLGLLVERWGL